MSITPVIHYSDRLVHDCILLGIYPDNFIDKYVTNKDELKTKDLMVIYNDFLRVYEQMVADGYTLIYKTQEHFKQLVKEINKNAEAIDNQIANNL